MNRDPFAAIADPTRRSIIETLHAKPHTMNDLASHFPQISRQAIGKQVKYLEDSGLVAIEQQGRERICHLQLQALGLVYQWLERYEAFWNKKFDNLHSYLDSQARLPKPDRQ